MKEDAQLICPLAYDDSYGVWEHLNKELSPHFPLNNITWKSPQGTTIQVTIEKLSVRCIPSGANLFKDTDHPFRWFLAPYVNIYIFVCDSAESYKSRKMKLKNWIDSLSGPKRSSWLVVYLPMGKQSLETYQKIYTKLANEIYFERAGDRSCVVYCNSSQASRQSAALSVIEKIKDGIITSFYQRCSLYDSEIRRLDVMRGTPQLDFRQLFLVKESLALMFQMMQLPSEALLQYEELEGLLAFAPTEALPDTDWPFVPFEPPSSGKHASKNSSSDRDREKKSTSPIGAGSTSEEGKLASAAKDDHVSGRGEADVVPIWMCVCQQGLSILRYSINHARMKVLKNQFGLLELQHYVFSRMCFFLFTLSRPTACAEKAIVFLNSVRSSIQLKVDAIEEKEKIELVNGDGSNTRRSVHLEQLNAVLLDGTGSVSNAKYSFENLNGVPLSVHRSNMADLWLIVSAIQLTKKCREVLAASVISQKNKHNTPSTPMPAQLLKRGESSNISENFDSSVSLEDEGKTTTSTSFISDESASLKSKAMSRQLIELLTLARSKLSHLIYQGHQFRRISLQMTQLFTRWDDYDAVAAQFPSVFADRDPHYNKESLSEDKDSFHCHPQGSLDEAIAAFPKKIQTLMQYHSEFTDKELHSEAFHRQRSASTSSVGGLFVSNSEIFELEADISVILLRLQLENEEISGRWRFACHSLLDCADILITNGNFLAAKIYLCAALEGNAVSPDCVLTRNMVPQSTGTLALWGQLRVWTLRKLILCYRALGDSHNFILVSLLLLDPSLFSFVSLEHRQHLQRNIMYVSTENAIVTDVKYHFKLRIQVHTCPSSSKSLSGGEVSRCPPLTMVTNTKSIHDEQYNAKTISCEAGITHCIYLSITNNFAESITTEEIRLVYIPFAPVVVHAAPSHRVNEEDSNSTNVVVCLPFQEFFSPENKIVLPSGETIIGMKFSPPCCGEFVPSHFEIKLNSSVTFVQTIESELNKLHQFFENNCLIDVVPPEKAMVAHPFPSAVTPVGQRDVGGVFILPDAADTVQSLSIQAKYVSKHDRAAHNENERSRNDSVSLVADHLPATVLMSDEKTSSLLPPDQLVLSVPEQWVFEYIPNGGGNDVEEVTGAQLSISTTNDELVVTDIPRNVTASLKIPFSTAQLAEANCRGEEYDIIFTIKGKMIRNACFLNFELQVEQSVVVADPLEVSQESTELFGGEYFSQCTVRNTSDIPWEVFNFSDATSTSRADSNGELHWEDSSFVLADDSAASSKCEGNTHGLLESSAGAGTGAGVLLHSGESFDVVLHLRQEDASPGVAFSPFRGSFPIRRCYTVAGEEEMGKMDRLDADTFRFYNATLFSIPLSICAPLLSPLVYSMDYHLRAHEISLPCANVGAGCETVPSAHDVGDPIRATYQLQVLFPAGSPPEGVYLVLSLACTRDWVVVGKTQTVVKCSPAQDNCVSLDITLVAIVAGQLMFPPLKVTAFSSQAHLNDSLRRTDGEKSPRHGDTGRESVLLPVSSSSTGTGCDDWVSLVPEASHVRVVPRQPVVSIFSLHQTCQ